MATAPARNMRPIITVVAIIVVVVLALVGYAGAGYSPQIHSDVKALWLIGLAQG